jgi:hypothetical protein
MSKAWPRWAGALGGFAFLVLFVVIPEGNKLAWAHSARLHLLAVTLGSGGVGALVGWGLVVVRNRLMVQR